MANLNHTELLLKEVVEAFDRMSAGRGAKGLMPSPRLQEALDEARRAVPTIAPQLGPRGDD